MIRRLKFIRAVILSILMAVFTILFCSVGLLFVLIRIKPLLDWWIQVWGRFCLALAGVRLTVEGRENLPKEGAIIVFNHTSLLDIQTVFAAISGSVRFGAKEELFKVPIFGHFLSAAGFLPIARARREEVFEVYKAAGERCEKGESFVLAPEGTRTDGKSIAPFKSGPMVLAIGSQAPILPVVLKGVNVAWGKDSRRLNPEKLSYDVKVRILPPVKTKGLGYEDRKSLSEEIRNSMQLALEDMLKG